MLTDTILSGIDKEVALCVTCLGDAAQKNVKRARQKLFAACFPTEHAKRWFEGISPQLAKAGAGLMLAKRMTASY